MKILIYLHHPAQFYLFRNSIRDLATNNQLLILATNKDILIDLLNNEGLSFINVLPRGRKDNKVAIAYGLLKQDYRLLKICLKYKPELLIGTSTEITHIGRLLNIPSLFFSEDDIDVIPLVGSIAYPFAKELVVPIVCSTGKWESKSINYDGYHELAYLHPNHFKPDPDIVRKYISTEGNYFLIRFAKLGAHHDQGVRGINISIARRIIKLLKPHGEVYISSERKLEDEFELYRLEINPLDIHHILAHAKLFIGDSQSMAMEAGVLGTPFIRFNDFVGRISVMNELEDKYQLGFGIKTSKPDQLFQTIENLINDPDVTKTFQARRLAMLADKIDVNKFIVWLIENYPESAKIMKKDPEYQYRFK